jgi:hypothetical protein
MDFSTVTLGIVSVINLIIILCALFLVFRIIKAVVKGSASYATGLFKILLLAAAFSVLWFIVNFTVS